MAESDLSGNINEEYIFFNGQRIARVDRPSGTVHYYFSDHLGSASVITDASGNVTQQYFYYPYGGLQSSIGSDSNHYKFNGKERDAESGLDNFGARYDSSTMGRFMTPDWAAKPVTVPYASFGDPQSLNLYSFVGNNPIDRADPDGHVSPGDFNCQIGKHCVQYDVYPATSDCEGAECGGGIFDLRTSVLESLIAEAGQIEAQNSTNSATGQSACGFLCRVFHTDHVPARAVILDKKTENEGSYSNFYYQLENKEGQKLTGEGYGVEEHISPSAGSTTSEGRFVPATNGVSRDLVGQASIDANGQPHSVTLPTSPNADFIVEQRFTVRYKGENYNLTTQFEHETKIVNGVVTNTVRDIVP